MTGGPPGGHRGDEERCSPHPDARDRSGGSDPISGDHDDERGSGEGQEFVGWLELARALESVLGLAPPAGFGRPSRVLVPGLGPAGLRGCAEGIGSRDA